MNQTLACASAAPLRDSFEWLHMCGRSGRLVDGTEPQHGSTKSGKPTHPVGDVVNHDDAVGSSVVSARDCPEALLSSCVPLQLPEERRETTKQINERR